MKLVISCSLASLAVGIFLCVGAHAYMDASEKRANAIVQTRIDHETDLHKGRGAAFDLLPEPWDGGNISSNYIEAGTPCVPQIVCDNNKPCVQRECK